jgi:hypothetical protein
MATPTTPHTQIATTDIDPTTPAPPPPSHAIPGITVNPQPAATASAAPPAGNVAPGSAAEAQVKAATGVDGEFDVWEAHYSMKNFLGRLVGMGLLTAAWIGLAIYVWGVAERPGPGWNALAAVSGVVVGVLWLLLARRIVLARFGHHYRLTNRRLFVSTGVFRRRRDQMELLKVQDVYTRQTLPGRLLSVGSVVVVSKEPNYPVMYLTGVEDPKAVMDLVWDQARKEREGSAVQVDQV